MKTCLVIFVFILGCCFPAVTMPPHSGLGGEIKSAAGAITIDGHVTCAQSVMPVSGLTVYAVNHTNGDTLATAHTSPGPTI